MTTADIVMNKVFSHKTRFNQVGALDEVPSKVESNLLFSVPRERESLDIGCYE